MHRYCIARVCSSQDFLKINKKAGSRVNKYTPILSGISTAHTLHTILIACTSMQSPLFKSNRSRPNSEDVVPSGLRGFFLSAPRSRTKRAAYLISVHALSVRIPRMSILWSRDIDSAHDFLGFDNRPSVRDR